MISKLKGSSNAYTTNIEKSVLKVTSVNIMKILGYIIFLLAGLYMVIVEILAFTFWWGTLGLLVGIFFPPSAILFPFIFWFKEGNFPSIYFIVWGFGLLGMVLANLGTKD